MSLRFILMFGVLWVSLLFYSFFFKWMKINPITFSAQNFWLEEEKKEKLIGELKEKTTPYHGMGVWKLSIRKLHRLIQEHPLVEDVQILRVWPNQFHVQLLSEPPVLLWLGNKLFYPITAQGRKLHPVRAGEAPDLPVLRGSVFSTQLEFRKKAAQLVQLLPKTGWLSQKNISEIKYSTKDSNFYIYLLQFSSPIRVGENLLEFRPDRVESVLRYLEQKQINWRVIDTRFSQKVVVSLDDDF